MKKILLCFTVLLVAGTTLTAQEWTFNDVVELNGWSPFRLDESFTTSHVTLTTRGQNNPRFDNASAGVDANTLKFAKITMRVASGGPSLLRVNFNGGFKTTPIVTGTTFNTYYLNMTDPDWSGTENLIELAYRDVDGTNGGGTHNSDDIAIDIEQIEFVANIYEDSTELYVDPTNGNDNNIGTTESPLKSIPNAVAIAAANDIANVYVKEGSYDIPNGIFINTIAPSQVTVSPAAGAMVTLNLGSFRNFRFYEGAKNIEVKGFEINGNSNATDHWTLLSEYVWEPQTLTNAQAGGGIAFQIEDAEDIKITDNVIHDFYQKAVNIEDGRYITVKGNIIYNIALTSLSGGHGIMRQQGSGSFTDPDTPGKYRWDLDGNFLFNVHQRIYSWVPSKGYLNMTLDEGKPFLIDETPDHDQNMTARITNNIVAFSKIDAIRLKPTNGLEVSNNSIFTQDEDADGITNTVNGFNGAQPFENFICNNNAVQVLAEKNTYDLVEAIASNGSSFANNYSGIGGIAPTTIATDLNTNLFVNPDDGDFSLIDGTLSNVGSQVLGELATRATNFGITIANDNWENDHLKNFQTLWDNVPGLEDGIVNNESVFTDAGIYDLSDLEFVRQRKALYFSINSTWQAANIPDLDVLDRGNGLDAYDGKYEIVVPEKYQEWYDEMLVEHLRDTDGDGEGDTPYDRLRYGASVLAQNKIFQDNSLHIVELKELDEYTITEGQGYDITLAGDLLIDFEFSPEINDAFDLILADNITGDFDNVSIEGYTGDYTLEVIDADSFQILRLTLAVSTALIYSNNAWSPNAPTAANNGEIVIVKDGTAVVTEAIDISTLQVDENATLEIGVGGSLQVRDTGASSFVNNGIIRFKSDQTGDGLLHELPNNPNYITGTGIVETETYLSAPRAFRLISPSVTTSSPIYDNWQEGGASPVGYGTHITGSIAGENGFDATASGNPSLFTVDVENQSFVSIPNTNVETLNAQNSYLLFSRGDRNANLNDNTSSGATTLRAKGSLLTGDVITTFPTATSGDFIMVGNPYQSAIVLNDVIANANTQGFSDVTTGDNATDIYIFDPTLAPGGGNGGYVLVDTSIDSPNRRLAPGFAFQMQVLPGYTAGEVQFQFSETNKTTDVGTASTRASQELSPAMISGELYTNANYADDRGRQDGFQIYLGDYSNDIDYKDAQKLLNSGENMGIQSAEKIIALERRATIDEGQIIQFFNNNYSASSYILVINLLDVQNENLVFIDAYTGEETPLSSGENIINFNVETEESKNPYRFSIGFREVLSVETLETQNVTIYPNPTDGTSLLNVVLGRSNQGDLDIELFDVLGRKISINWQNVSSNVAQVDMSSLTVGTYLLRITTGKSVLTRKVIKN